MSDTTEAGTPTPADEPRSGPSIRVQSQYIKDLSFENPGVPVQGQPNVDLGIDVGATPKNVEQGIYEITLKLQARAGTKEAALFLVELDYAGIFQVSGFAPSDLEPLLLIECPRILFPFARRIIADLTADGGFPALRIDTVDFHALFRSQKQRQAEAATAAAPAEKD